MIKIKVIIGGRSVEIEMPCAISTSVDEKKFISQTIQDIIKQLKEE